MLRIWENFGSTITPIGAALNEATSDEEQETIQYRFQKFGECPTSDLFPTIEAVEEFYDHSFGIIGVLKTACVSPKRNGDRNSHIGRK
jgi:hypothetical protein